MQYALTQHPGLLAQISDSPIDLLREALESHRTALALNQSNPNVLFNTAQLLSSLGEAVGEDRSNNARNEAQQLLSEAFPMLERCLHIQEMQFEEDRNVRSYSSHEGSGQEHGQSLGNDVDDAPEPIEPVGGEDNGQEQWVLVVEPVTEASLLDTMVAQLETLTTLCRFLPQDASATQFVGEISGRGERLLWEKIPKLLIHFSADECGAAERDAKLARAHLYAAIADFEFRRHVQTAEQYYAVIEQEFSDAVSQPDHSVLCSYAEALIDFNAALSDAESSSDADRTFPKLRWQALSQAQKALGQASSRPGIQESAQIVVARGDVELLRWRVSRAAGATPSQRNSGETLLRNAQVRSLPFSTPGICLLRRAKGGPSGGSASDG